MLRACRVQRPGDIATARLEHSALVLAMRDELAEFKNLQHLNVAGNGLTLGGLSKIQNLEVLEMALNAMTALDPGDGFRNLTILDLSYNKIAPSELLNLGMLPKLQSLDLTGNDLNELPMEMAYSGSEETNMIGFQMLETWV